MCVRAIYPGGGRDGDKMMAEIDKYVYQVPMAYVKGIRFTTSLRICIAVVSPRHIMTGEQPGQSREHVLLYLTEWETVYP
jgi:hypothetical protein